jgi:hypothetical protein
MVTAAARAHVRVGATSWAKRMERDKPKLIVKRM